MNTRLAAHNTIDSVKASENALVSTEHNTTRFTNEADQVHAARTAVTGVSSKLLSNASTSVTASIEQFLSRPVIIRSGDITTSSAGVLDQFFSPSDLFALTIYGEKVSGFYGFRGTLLCKLQVNANRFQQGRLILGYIPEGNTGTLNRLIDHTTVTQLPHVQLDFNTDSEVDLEIPFIVPWTHFNVRSMEAVFDNAHVFVWVYSPLLVGTGSNHVNYTLWASFKDVELVAPTIAQADGFASANKPYKVRRKKKNQMRSMDPSESEQQATNTGPVSSFFSGVTKVATALQEVPFLTQIATPVAWVSNALSGIASIFGWSNPLNVAPAQRIVQTEHPFKNNCDNIDLSQPVALMSDNKLQMMPELFGTEIDEMSMAYLCQVPAFYTSFDWTTSDSMGDILFSKTLDASSFFNTATAVGVVDTVTYRTYTPISYLSRFFNFWRGSLRFTFKLVKTEFHTGRLVAVFIPGEFSTSTPTLDDTVFLHREIIDIREGNEFTITMPYVNLWPYCTTANGVDLSQGNSIDLYNLSYGTIYIMVLNELVAPDTVSSDIQILTEVSGAEDFEYAVPTQNAAPRVFAQGGEPSDENPKSKLTDPIGIGNAAITYDELSSAASCIGERVLSILQLLKRSTRLHTIADATTTFNIAPYTLMTDNLIAGTYDPMDFEPDYMHSLCALYAFYRGGVRIRLGYSSIGTDLGTERWFFFQAGTVAPYSVGAATPSPNQISMVAIDNSHTYGAEIQVPQYHSTYMRECRYISPIENTHTLPMLQRRGTAITGGYLERQAADDFQLGFFLGVPQIFVSSIPTPP